MVLMVMMNGGDDGRSDDHDDEDYGNDGDDDSDDGKSFHLLLSSYYLLSPDFDGYAVTNITLKVPGLPWDTAYSQSTSSAYLNLKQEITDLVSVITSNHDVLH